MRSSTRPCCRLRLVGTGARGLSSGAGDEECGLAVFKPWHEREIRRLFVKRVVSKSDSASVIREVCGTDLTVREHLVLIGLDRTSRIRGISDGTSSAKSLCRFNFADAVNTFFKSHETARAGVTEATRIVRFVMGHNHPSGDAQASPDDIRTTRHFAEAACRGVGIPLVEHMIVTSPAIDPPWPGAFYLFSMREQYGDGFFPGCPKPG